MSSFSDLKRFGVGLSFQESYINDLLEYKHLVQVIEVKPEHYFANIKEYTKELHIIAEEFPLIAHGLFMSVGSFEPFHEGYMKRLNEVIANSPPLHWLGEHMGFTRVGEKNLPHFVNIPLSSQSLEIITAKIHDLQKTLSLPVAFENIPWEFAYPESTMNEAEFFSELVKKTNTPLLLDATNLYANHINHKWNLDEYFKTYPVQNVIQIHFNGGFVNDKGIYIDSHSKPAPPEVWDMIEQVIDMGAPLKALILERDDNPPLDELAPELERANKLMEKC